MNNQDKATANYAKRFIREKGQSAVTQIRDSEYSTICPSSKYKFCEKEHGSYGCWQLQTECHFCHYVGHIAQFCKKKSSPMTSPPKNLIICTWSIPSHINWSLYIQLTSCTVTSKYHKSSFEVIIDSGTMDPFFANRTYFSTCQKYHHDFQTNSEEILTANGYGDVMLRLADPDSSEVTWTIKKVS